MTATPPPPPSAAFPSPCVLAHLGSHGVGARGEQLGDHRRLEAVLRQAHGGTEARAAGAHHHGVKRVINCARAGSRRLKPVTLSPPPSPPPPTPRRAARTATH
jgi:hypothetical protein